MSEPSGIPVWSSPVLSVVAAILSVAQAVFVIQKRLARVHDVEIETTRLPRLPRWFYVRLQQLYMAAFIAIAAIGAGGFLAFVLPEQITFAPFVFARNNGKFFIIVWVVVGVVAATNVISWFVVLLGALLDKLQPSGALGGQHHPDWYAFRSFVQFDGDAKPLIVDDTNALALADWLLQELTANPNVINRASPPGRPDDVPVQTFRAKVGNALLIGCVLEGAKYQLSFDDRDWGSFYDVIGTMALDDEWFAPSQITSARGDWPSFAAGVLRELNRRLFDSGQPTIPDSPRVRQLVATTFDNLASQCDGNVAALHYGRSFSNSKLLSVAHNRLKKIVTLTSEGIRANFVKLAVIWDVWHDVPLLAFRFPFSHRVAAVLLDRRVVRAPKNVDALAFAEGSTERHVIENAEQMVMGHAIRLIESDRRRHETWLPAGSRGTSGEVFHWWVAYELDLRLWDCAKRLHEGSAQGQTLTTWKYQNEQVARVSSSH